MTPQSSFMVTVPVIAAQRDALNDVLASMNEAPGRVNKNNSIIPFHRFSSLHTARFVILDNNTGDDIRAFGKEPHNWSPALAFLGEVDGCSTDFLAELAVVSSEGLKQIFANCHGFADHKGPLLEFLIKHTNPSAASYVNWIGRTVRQIQEERQLQHFLAKQLKSIRLNDPQQPLRTIRQKLLSELHLEQHAGRLTLSSEQRTPLRVHLRRLVDLVLVPIVLLAAFPVLLCTVPLIFIYLRIIEARDPDIDIRPSPVHVQELSKIEDFHVSNQFNVFGDVKPGLFRYILLKSVMAVVNYSARVLYRKGFLARVRTIHFARWVFLNEGKSMYFASMYDGSLESYMDDFINKTAFGLNLTFSHGVGYPRTSWMLKGGAEHEQQFKDTLRRHQLPSAVWYSAYPGLTAFDLARHARIRQGVEKYPRTEDDIRLWLQEI